MSSSDLTESDISKIIKIWTIITIGLVTLWLVFGIYLFLEPEHKQFWSIGELGDYFGGGLGGLAIVMIIVTTILQGKQLHYQSSELKESGVMKAYELFKPELEGLSVRIVSKFYGSSMVNRTHDFNDLYKKYQSDKTVFLREIPKMIDKVPPELDKELSAAIKDYQNICEMFETNLKDPAISNDFEMAMLKTEIFKCYNALKQLSNLSE